ncbi:enoyl-CoA hydratase-related protein [Novosphingobium malaysiense]|uniref:Enoyl-CoA hydratase n=1 Tax=Novosphingobium malaysiense TaxID=1348853 RepID=A0A0B1ZJ38_9SPHN|nr:enoyl-CoA hydratase-related protein [Novosphingobium malaysiense]KHK89191.1 enoyl-CoA hydratase [Novosphingobium malaysiense]
MSEALLIEEHGEGVMFMTLNRPASRNAINLDLVDALSAALADLNASPRWRSAVLTGAPPAFCAGLDLKDFSAPDAPRHKVTELVTSIPHCAKPLIAAVNGAAYTGGLEIVLSCDFTIASEEARFADTHARIGALSGSGMGSRLPRRVGGAWAKQMMFTSAPIDAQTALRIGLVNEIWPQERVVPRALELAEMIAAHDPELVGIVKAVVDRGMETTLGEAVAIEREALAERKRKGAMAWKA